MRLRKTISIHILMFEAVFCVGSRAVRGLWPACLACLSLLRWSTCYPLIVFASVHAFKVTARVRTRKPSPDSGFVTFPVAFLRAARVVVLRASTSLFNSQCHAPRYPHVVLWVRPTRRSRRLPQTPVQQRRGHTLTCLLAISTISGHEALHSRFTNVSMLGVSTRRRFLRADCVDPAF